MAKRITVKRHEIEALEDVKAGDDSSAEGKGEFKTDVDVAPEHEPEEAEEDEPELPELPDMRFDAPTATFDAGEVIANEIDRAPGIRAPKARDRRADAACELYPYTPYPKAQELDTVIRYSHDEPAHVEIFNRTKGLVTSTSRAVGLQLRRVLASRTLAHMVHDRERGRLNRRQLHTLNRPGRQPNKRVFSEKHEGKAVDTAIGILIDQSGSMNGSKINTAQQATIALGEALAGLANFKVKFGVWGFDSGNHVYVVPPYRGKVDRTEPLRFHWYKGFDESWQKVGPRVGAMQALANNCDGECVRWAAHQLLTQTKAERKILITISDGEPCCDSDMNSRRIDADLRHAVRQVNDLGIETFAIGVEDSAVTRFYPHNIVIKSCRDLERTLIAGMQKLLLDPKGKAA